MFTQFKLTHIHNNTLVVKKFSLLSSISFWNLGILFSGGVFQQLALTVKVFSFQKAGAASTNRVDHKVLQNASQSSSHKKDSRQSEIESQLSSVLVEEKNYR